MGDILFLFLKKYPHLFIERIVDAVETQKLRFVLDRESWISVGAGEQITVRGRDQNGSSIELEIPISISELRMALDKYDFEKGG